ncbi:tetratricopeptide repeat-containing sensor histidine kinase [Tenacibaculum amylolyticum]|uniref:tetratricopeptide repeat-containing sensor histidine kinase n=1 Tax=Tenacibaculum amylolyticum TaxID=104269 RepID=UPI0038947D41
MNLFCYRFFLTYLLLFFIQSFSQNKDVLLLNKLDNLIKISKSKPNDSLFYYTNKYIDIAIKNKAYEKAFNTGLDISNHINFALGQSEKALIIIEKLEKQIHNINKSRYKGEVYLKKGDIFFNGKSFIKAIDNYTKAINNFSSKDSISAADAHLYRGQAYFNTNNFFEALHNYKTALAYYTKLKDLEYVYSTRSEIINIYGMNDFIEKTIKERKELIADKTKTNHALSTDYINLALDYKKNKQYKEQEKALLIALSSAKKEKAVINNIPVIYAKICQFYLEQDNIEQATVYYKLAKKSVKGTESFQYLYFLYLKSFFLYKTNKLDEALLVAKQTLKKAENQNHTQLVIDVKERLYKIYEAKNNFSKAHEFHKSYTALKDSIFNIKKLNILYYYQSLHEASVKEQKILEQKTNINLLIKDQKNKRLLLILIIISAISIIVLTYLLLSRFFLKRSQELHSKYSQNLLSTIDAERKRIAKDIHDSLGHKLLLAKNYGIRNNSSKNNLIDEAIDEIRVISKNLQPVQIQQIGITKSIKNLIDNLNNSSSDILLFGDIRNIDNLLNSDQEVNLYRIIQECLNNIIKHSKAESSKVDISYRKKSILLSIMDNGIGFNYQEKYKNIKNLGLKNLKTRVKLINGSIHISSFKRQGTIVKINIPVNEA